MSYQPDPRVIDPTRPTGPGVHYPDYEPDRGEPEAGWAQQIDMLGRQLAMLEDAIRSDKRRIPVSGVAQESTDSSGNCVFSVYEVGAGFQFNLHRVLVEANGYTPASPYTAASAWFGLFIADTYVGSPAQGQMIDFAPTTAGLQLFPHVAEYDNTIGGPLARTGEIVVARCATGPASTRLTVRYQGHLEASQ